MKGDLTVKGRFETSWRHVLVAHGAAEPDVQATRSGKDETTSERIAQILSSGPQSAPLAANVASVSPCNQAEKYVTPFDKKIDKVPWFFSI